MSYKKGLAQKAIAENLSRYVDLKAHPEQHNLHVALSQIAEGIDDLLEEQRATKRLLEHLAGHLLR